MLIIRCWQVCQATGNALRCIACSPVAMQPAAEMAQFGHAKYQQSAEVDPFAAGLANELTHHFQHFSVGWFVDPTT